MRLTHSVQSAGCAAKLGPGQLSQILGHLPKSMNPNLLVGFETRDDAGIYKITEDLALVQTLDFFPPIVDDPYWFGAIAAANALSDVFAMGGMPITVMNICCFSLDIAPSEVWAQILKGAYDKTIEAGAVVVGGHTIDDSNPKFGMSVTGTVHPNEVFSNDRAEEGDDIYLSKPLGTGILTTAAKRDQCDPSWMEAGIKWMATLNLEAMLNAKKASVKCATDITGFGLAGHLFNVARASGIVIELDSAAFPVYPGLDQMVKNDCVTGGSRRNRDYLAENLHINSELPQWMHELVVDPQTSGGLAVFSKTAVEGSTRIGRVLGKSSGKIVVR